MNAGSIPATTSITALLGLVATCTPTVAGFLQVPVSTEDGKPRDLAVVEVPLAELATRMRRYDPDRLAFYAGGRSPVPHRLEDRDGDGEPDVALVKMRIDPEGTFLVVVSPGPRAGGRPPEGGSAEGVVLRFDAATR